MEVSAQSVMMSYTLKAEAKAAFLEAAAKRGSGFAEAT